MKTIIIYLILTIMLVHTQNLEAQQLKAGKNKVTFQSEGLTLKGDLYLPPSYQKGDKLPAVVVGGSWTTVKEQMAGLYADKLAKEGYVTLAFDHRNYGESEGEPRFYEDPQAKTVEFIHAAEYLKSLPMVDKNRIAGMGVCASGGYMAEAVARSPIFKSYAMVVPWFNTDEVVNAFYGGNEGIEERIGKSREAEKLYKEKGVMTYIPTISDSDKSAAMYGPFGYYLDEKLGKVPNWSSDKFALTSWEPWLTYRPVPIASRINTPTIMITSKGAATPAADEEFYALLKGKKELLWMDGGQLDFYYQPELVNQVVKKIATYLTVSL